MAQQLPSRSHIDPALTWDLRPLFPDNAAWEQAFLDAAQLIDGFPALEGVFCASQETLLDALERESEISLLLERLYVYAHMRRDEDNAIALYQGMTDRAMQLSARFSEAAAFMSPEILEIDEAQLDAWLEGDVLLPYRRVLKNLVRGRAHTLSKAEERIMALVSEPLSASDQVFTMLNNADIRFKEVEDDAGDAVELTQSNYRRFIESPNRDVRMGAYRAMYSAYTALQNTIGATYAASVKADVFHARARKHGSAIEAALFSGNVPFSVYDGLVEAVESRLPALREYLELRKRVLNVDQLHMYDLYVPIVKEKKRPMEYEEAKALVKAALAPLGSHYADMLDRAYTQGWIDVCENRNKTTGAYSWGAYGTHPYVLLNYQPDASYAFTIAHELGHAMHTHYSDTALRYQDAQYRIMAAEVASTVNEVLLMQYMLEHEADDDRRAYLLNHYLEQFRTTVFRQTMFAAFEQKTHAMCEAGEPLTVESLCALYGQLNEKYYPGVLIDDDIRMEWARIPHFYRAFYVYQYATGFCAAIKLAKGILKGGGDREKYIAFLKSGGSDFPIELLKNAGVDLRDKNSLLSSLDEFDSAVKSLRALLL